MKMSEADFLNNLLEKEKQKQALEEERKISKQEKEYKELEERFENISTEALELAIDIYDKRNYRINIGFLIFVLCLVFGALFYLSYTSNDLVFSLAVYGLAAFVALTSYVIAYSVLAKDITPYKLELKRRQENNEQ